MNNQLAQHIIALENALSESICELHELKKSLAAKPSYRVYLNENPKYQNSFQTNFRSNYQNSKRIYSNTGYNPKHRIIINKPSIPPVGDTINHRVQKRPIHIRASAERSSSPEPDQPSTSKRKQKEPVDEEPSEQSE